MAERSVVCRPMPDGYVVVYFGCTLDFMSRSCPCGRHDGQEVDRGAPRAPGPCTNAAKRDPAGRSVARVDGLRVQQFCQDLSRLHGARPGTSHPGSLLPSPGHAVADPALVDGPGRAGGVIAEPVAQPLDVGAHELGLAVAPSDPNLAQQSLVRQDQAGLNYGDCFAYALARQLGEPLLCKGDDFSQTDLSLL